MPDITSGVNTMTYPQLAAVFNAVQSQATGKTTIAPVNTSEFVSCAQTTLLTGYDTVMNAISQVLSRTIFSIRPYYRKFPRLRVSREAWGNHVRKLQACDLPMQDDQSYAIEDGKSYDQMTVRLPKVLQTNFYGGTPWKYTLTRTFDQLNQAFRGPDEFGQFIAMVTQNVMDSLEQYHESIARACIANYIGGKIAGDPTNCLHLVTMYNDEKGTAYTWPTIVQNPDVYEDFARWMWGTIETVSDFMTERSLKYHTNPTGYDLPRHTPYARQRCYLQSGYLNKMVNEVMSVTFHDRLVKVIDHERVNFWQSIDTPYGVQVTPVYMAADGTLTSPANPVTQSMVLGVLCDEEAIGYTVISEKVLTSPINADAQYVNTFWHVNDRYYNDFTENGIILLLD